jgi:transmembrane sensor
VADQTARGAATANMTKSHDDNGHREMLDRIEGEARAWIVRLTSGAATQADAEACAAWRALPEHDAAFLAAARLWQQTGAALGGQVPSTDRRIPSLPTRRHVLHRAAWSVSAASVAAASGAVALRWPELNATHRTGTGEIRTIVLAGGTRLDLDAETSVDVSAEAQQQVLTLITGALVVTATGSLPVAVQAGDTRTTARAGLIGELGITCRPASDGGWFGNRIVTISCLAGEAEFRSSREAASTLLRAGDGIEVGRGSSIARKVDETVVAWRRGLLVFRDTPLAAVVDDLNRYRPGRIILAGTAAARRVTGVFHLDRPDEALASIRAALGLSEYRVSERFVILR